MYIPEKLKKPQLFVRRVENNFQLMWHICDEICIIRGVKLKLATVKLKAKSANTLKSYKGKETRFLNWLSSEEPSFWDEGVPEVIIERTTSGMICSFISEESQWPDGSMKKFGTAESINSALVYYYHKRSA